jgi:putative hydrolase of the HAD superfamily
VPNDVAEPRAGDERRRWLLLDIGGVLEIVDDEAWPSRFRNRWTKRLGLTGVEWARRVEAAHLPDTRTRSGVVDEFWAAYGSALGASESVTAEMRENFWDEYCGTPNRELLEALQPLKDRVGLAILSNSGDGAREEEERRYGFSTLFDPICYSHETGFNKPDPRAFQAALRLMAADPGDILFIDNWPPNIDAAHDLGLRTHLHRENAETLARICEFVSS